MKKSIYLDHAASTPPYAEVVSAVENILDRQYANPISSHTDGQEGRALIDEARVKAANFFRTELSGIIFTSGATEAMHMAVIGTYLHNKNKPGFTSRILLSPLSHTCGYNAAEFCRKHFNATVEHIPYTKEGYYNWEELDEAYVSSFDIIITEHGSSEIGAIQDINCLKSMAPKSVLIADCSASIVTEHVNLETLDSDIVLCSGEKIGALKGAGILALRKGTRIEPIVTGSQEWGLRGGTENLIGIVALEQALIQHEKTHETRKAHYQKLWNTAYDFIIEHLPQVQITTPKENILPDIFHFLLPKGVLSSTFVVACDQRGVRLSGGPACASGAPTGSKTLKALGYTEDEARRGVRMSFGRKTSENELKEALNIIKNILS